MSNQINNRVLNRSTHVYANNQPSQKKTDYWQKDTLSPAVIEMSHDQKKDLFLQKVELPKAPEPTKDYLDELVAALSAIYGSMAHGAQTQADRLSLQQNATQDLTQAIFNASNDAIDKQKKDLELQQQVISLQGDSDTLNTVFKWLQGIGLVVGIVLGVFDGMATEGAAIEGLEDLATAGNVAKGLTATVESEAVATEATTNTLLETEAVKEGSSSTTLEAAQATQTSKQEGEIGQIESQVASKGKKGASFVQGKGKFDWSTKKIGSWIAFRAYKLVINSTLTIPQFMQGLTDIKKSEAMAKLAQAQLDTGNALSVLERNKQYFKFLQQGNARSADVEQRLVEELSDVADTASKAMKTVRQISTGLAQAV